jgi:hypothetical protein
MHPPIPAPALLTHWSYLTLSVLVCMLHTRHFPSIIAKTPHSLTCTSTSAQSRWLPGTCPSKVQEECVTDSTCARSDHRLEGMLHACSGAHDDPAYLGV